MIYGVVVFAYHNVGVNGIKLLLENNIHIHCVFTHKHNSNENIWFDSVSELCKKKEIQFYYDDECNIYNILKNYNISTIFSFYYRKVIPQKIISLAKYGGVNLHGSLLPKYRGRSPINWQIINGETQGGATLHFMSSKPDEGDIIDQEVFLISKFDEPISLFSKLIFTSTLLLNRNLKKIISGKSKGKKQNPFLSSYYGSRKPEDGLINWSWNSKKIYNLIRGVTKPFPGAFSYYLGYKIIIWKSSFLSKNRYELEGSSGTFSNINNRIYVKTNDGILCIEKFDYKNIEYTINSDLSLIFPQNCLKKFD